ncbi:hypothetical protein IFM89_038805 [Coptis chinensis]|uniref:Uncharacterized protein n=1 Tax=Coptis chinensis TaxID=261450 RepID=A0A835HJL6_9MAGN|nr:hypothetical protein IFM89_038805 [Coptis chinensis]
MDDEEGEDFGVGNVIGNEYVNGSLSEKDVQLRIDDTEESRGDIQGSGVRTNMVGRLELGDCEKDGDDVQRSPADVPAEEMLSDDYYEQDGDDQSDSFHHKEVNRSTTSNLKKLSRPVSFKKNVLKKSKSGNADGDYYEEEDDDDEEDNTFFGSYLPF